MFIPCRQCQNGYKRIAHTDSSSGLTYHTVAKCECLTKHQQRSMLEIAVKRAGLRPSILEWSPPYHPSSHYKGTASRSSADKLVRYVENIDDPSYSRQSLYLAGSYSTQKTTLAQWAGLELLQRGKKVHYTLMRTLLNALVDEHHSWSDSDRHEGKSRRSLLQQVQDVDVLIIDESFDPQKMTMYKSGYQLPFLDEFLRDRLDVHEQPTIFVSNVHIKDIDKQFLSLKSLLERRIALHGAELDFKDNFVALANSFDVKDIFA